MTDPELLPVTQEDREAAALHYLFVHSRIKVPHSLPLQSKTFDQLRAGLWDKDDSVQAFARHRLATTDNAELVRAIEPALPFLERFAGHVEERFGVDGGIRRCVENIRLALARTEQQP